MNLIIFLKKKFLIKSLDTGSELYYQLSRSAITFLLILIVILLISGCAATGGYREAEYGETPYTDLKIYGQFDREFSSTYFGSFKFVFENKTDQWIDINDIRLSFDNDSAQKYIKVLDQDELEQWAKSIQLQKNLHTSAIKDIQSTLMATGSSFSGIVGDVGEGIGFDSGEQKKRYPNNHLFAEKFIIPSGFAVEKWVLFNSSHQESIPYVTKLNMELLVNEKPRKAKITFREDNPKYTHFIWYDPERDVDLDFYLGVNVALIYPTGGFSEVAKRGDRLFSSFGVNGYLAVLNHFGLNFSLDYQTYEARGKTTSLPDSTLTLGTNIEFYQWQLLNFLISPRFVYNLVNELDLFVELAGGIALSFTPRVIATRYGLEIYEIEPASSFSFVGGAAVGTRIYFSEKFNLDLKLEYLPVYNAKFELDDDLFGSLARNQNMDHLQIKAGLYWKL